MLFFILFTQSEVFLQNNNDFFPLSAGSYYLYKYNSSFYAFDMEFMDSEGVNDTGWVQYSIEGFERKDTVVIWNIKEKDSVYTRHYRNSADVKMDTCYWTVGEHYFELKESLTGDHKLTCNSGYGIWDSPINISWPFRPQLYRYKADSNSLVIDFDILSARTTVILEKNTGLTSYHYQYSFGNHSQTSRDEKAVLIKQFLTSLNSVNEIKSLKHEYFISQNYPNPFNPATTIRYSIPKPSHVQLKIFDLLGREISTLVNAEKNAGEYTVQFNALQLPSGTYIYSIQAGEFRDSKKFMLLK